MLQINDLTFDAWGRRFFDEASVTIPVGAKVGVVGRNGVGKSTLFRLIKDQLEAGGGEISLPRAARMGSVDQEHPATPVSLIDSRRIRRFSRTPTRRLKRRSRRIARRHS